jgi:two-component system, chemotaxis family, sensor kinase CheA
VPDEMDMSQYREMFISEAQEHLQEMNKSLLELEKTPGNVELLNNIFRNSHTLKGMAATMGYDNITRLSHQMEDVLDKLRKGETKVNPDIINVLFECFDSLQQLVNEVVNNKEQGLDLSGISGKLEAILKGTLPSSGPASPVPTPVPLPGSEPEQKKPVTEEAGVKTATLDKKSESVRVNIKQLDALMNLVGELVINKAQLAQIGNKHKIAGLGEALSQVDRITADLQTEVLKTRMVPVSLIFDRFPRVVRDISKTVGKDINLEISGRDIELDRIILEELNDPLVHLIRNSVDHGIEDPETRLKNNKPKIGTIKLNATRGKGFVTIEVADDGKGLDRDKLRQTAVAKGIISEDEAALLPDREVLMLICDPRFTTAAKVTDISGRGVGMDVVKTKIEAFSGSLEIRSEKGKGSQFLLKLPLTLAIIKVLLVKVKDEVYAIPLSNISEIVTVKSDEIKTIGKEEVVLLRDKVLPLRRLGEVFFNNVEMGKDAQFIYIVAVESSGKEIGLVIDAFIGQEEIVIKTLGGLLKKAKGFSGSTILGDGRVVLIVDVNSLL